MKPARTKPRTPRQSVSDLVGDNPRLFWRVFFKRLEKKLGRNRMLELLCRDST